MEYRKATAQDTDALLRLRYAFLKEDHPGLSETALLPIRQQLPGYVATHLDRDLMAFLAVDEGRAVAAVFLLVNEKPANPGTPNGRAGTLLNVYTEPAYRRRGIATALIQMAMAEAKRQALSVVTLKATAMGAPLYFSLGFTESKSKYVAMEYDLK